jgi:hypothetical protein
MTAFSSSELAYLAELLGGTFPGIASNAPPGVREALARRGTLDDAGTLDGAVRAALECALSGNGVTLAASDGTQACSVSFFVAGSQVVRYEIDEEERHVLEPADRDTARAHLDEIVRAVAGARGETTDAVPVDSERLSDVARLVARGEEARARTLLPEAPGYVDALSDLRLVASVTAHARHADEIRMTSVSVVQSPSQGLWLVDTSGGSDDEVSIAQVSGPDLARRLDALLDDVAGLRAI